MKRVGLSVIALFLLAAPAFAQMAPAKIADTPKGKALVDEKGMTLYVYDKDATGKSNCDPKCTAKWPPFKATADAKASGDWSIVKRTDGAMQWAYKGKPLYLWEKDKAPGDVTGEGVNNVWHIAAP